MNGNGYAHSSNGTNAHSDRAHSNNAHRDDGEDFHPKERAYISPEQQQITDGPFYNSGIRNGYEGGANGHKHMPAPWDLPPPTESSRTTPPAQNGVDDVPSRANGERKNQRDELARDVEPVPDNGNPFHAVSFDGSLSAALTRNGILALVDAQKGRQLFSSNIGPEVGHSAVSLRFSDVKYELYIFTQKSKYTFDLPSKKLLGPFFSDAKVQKPSPNHHIRHKGMPHQESQESPRPALPPQTPGKIKGEQSLQTPQRLPAAALALMLPSGTKNQNATQNSHERNNTSQKLPPSALALMMPSTKKSKRQPSPEIRTDPNYPSASSRSAHAENAKKNLFASPRDTADARIMSAPSSAKQTSQWQAFAHSPEAGRRSHKNGQEIVRNGVSEPNGNGVESRDLPSTGFTRSELLSMGREKLSLWRKETKGALVSVNKRLAMREERQLKINTDQKKRIEYLEDKVEDLKREVRRLKLERIEQQKENQKLIRVTNNLQEGLRTQEEQLEEKNIEINTLKTERDKIQAKRQEALKEASNLREMLTQRDQMRHENVSKKATTAKYADPPKVDLTEILKETSKYTAEASKSASSASSMMQEIGTLADQILASLNALPGQLYPKLSLPPTPSGVTPNVAFQQQQSLGMLEPLIAKVRALAELAGKAGSEVTSTAKFALDANTTVSPGRIYDTLVKSGIGKSELGMRREEADIKHLVRDVHDRFVEKCKEMKTLEERCAFLHRERTELSHRLALREEETSTLLKSLRSTIASLISSQSPSEEQTTTSAQIVTQKPVSVDCKDESWNGKNETTKKAESKMQSFKNESNQAGPLHTMDPKDVVVTEQSSGGVFGMFNFLMFVVGLDESDDEGG